MKKGLILLFAFIMAGCSNSRGEDDMEKTVNEDTWEISVKAPEHVEHKYRLMESFPVEGGPTITKEPNHAVVSELSYEKDGIYYIYQPEAGFTGTDEVEITNNISNGWETVAQTILKLSIEVRE